MTVPLRLVTAGLTHTGVVRTVNEDSMLVRDDAQVFVVADGMGGHANGQFASTTIVEQVAASVLTHEFDADVQALAAAVHSADRAIAAAAQAAGATMGSTVVVLHLDGARFACLWAGDSRIYLMRGGELHALTRDHTQVQDMVEAGLLTAKEAKRHPMGHVLSRAVGVAETLQLDVIVDEAQAGDIFLLCSDGLHGVVSDQEIAERLGALSLGTACNRLIELTLARGAPDNVTVVGVACEQVTALPFGRAEPARVLAEADAHG